MTEERQKKELRNFDYCIGDPIKNSTLLHEQNHPLRYQNFFQTAQMLFHLRANPGYLEYTGEELQRLSDLLGLEFGENMEEDPIQIPGILTDLVCSFRKKLATLPNLDPKYLKGKSRKENPDWWDYVCKSEAEIDEPEKSYRSRDNDREAIKLYRASHFLHDIEQEWQLGLNVMFFAPHLCDTREKMRKYLLESFSCGGQQESNWTQEEIDERIERNLKQMEEWGVEPLGDLTNKALAFVKEYAPNRYERFSKAVFGNKKGEQK